MSENTPHDRFPSTLWTLVSHAHARDDEGRKALARVIERYLPAMRDYLRSAHRMRPEDADDLLQSFVLEKFLEKELTSKADRTIGKFRALLTASLDRFVISQARKKNAQRRGANSTLPMDDRLEVASAEESPAQKMEVAWARETLAEAVQRMREECEQTNRLDVWDIFESRILAEMLEMPAAPYEELASRHNLSSPANASNLLVTGKRMFVRNLRSVVAEYEPNPSRVDAEIADLREVVGRCPLPPARMVTASREHLTGRSRGEDP